MHKVEKIGENKKNSIHTQKCAQTNKHNLACTQCASKRANKRHLASSSHFASCLEMRARQVMIIERRMVVVMMIMAMVVHHCMCGRHPYRRLWLFIKSERFLLIALLGDKQSMLRLKIDKDLHQKAQHKDSEHHGMIRLIPRKQHANHERNTQHSEHPHTDDQMRVFLGRRVIEGMRQSNGVDTQANDNATNARQPHEDLLGVVLRQFMNGDFRSQAESQQTKKQ
mmetsp:Transcript_28181/g.44694  ORF Transcript_28181/g.44694 Transcript_28181/m.44694 type:complete len:225 (+) Transcript_28181:139-813(+)